MGTVWECLWEYLYLDTMEVKLYPYWLTPSEAGHIRVLVEFDGGRKLLHTRRERVGPAAWLEACEVEPYARRLFPLRARGVNVTSAPPSDSQRWQACRSIV
ncbi:hypothetical protein WK91_35845 [Burkholderia cepacia]|nr:hypothetical protein WK91_35845 [Burkholderia cepacia]